MPKYKVIGKCLGMTGYRGQFYFRDGICVISDADDDEAANHRRIAARLLPRDYAAYPVEIADQMHEKWLAKDKRRREGRRRAHNGSDDIPTDGPQSGVSPPVRNDLRSAWNDVAKESDAINGSPTDEGQPGGAEPTTSNPTGESTIRVKAVDSAARGLDWRNDAHWTGGGKPRLDHMSADAGFSVTFEDVQSVLPGFDRQMAQALAGE